MYKIAEHDENVLNKQIKDFQRDIIELEKHGEMYKSKLFNDIQIFELNGTPRVCQVNILY